MIISVTLTLDTSAYASGDLLADTQEITNYVSIAGTSSYLQSLDGSTGGGPDISAALFSPTTLRIGERPTGQTPANGTIHHVVLASGAQTQAQLNALCAAVHALPVA